ncbi:MAG TPA: LysM peptidoglycan-binding domain-containing protein, partial [Pyrinomonadaceae bacterium]|nr:LysM peptidoglycan-binding domain-containing protein [Pyrinomonadaceae bacterium]
MSGSKIGFNPQTTNNFGATDKQTTTKTPLQTKVLQTDEYTVRRGDTLTEIAAKTGQNLQELLQKNRQIKNPNKIYVGQKIEVGNRSTDYTVKAGDTLSEIAKAKHTTVGEIMRANAGQIGNRNLI